jgi:hypothetical protein
LFFDDKQKLRVKNFCSFADTTISQIRRPFSCRYTRIFQQETVTAVLLPTTQQ